MELENGNALHKLCLEADITKEHNLVLAYLTFR